MTFLLVPRERFRDLLVHKLYNVHASKGIGNIHELLKYEGSFYGFFITRNIILYVYTSHSYIKRHFLSIFENNLLSWNRLETGCKLSDMSKKPSKTFSGGLSTY